jgi:hypothetical protein
LAAQRTDRCDVVSGVVGTPSGGKRFEEQHAGLKGCQRPYGRVNSGE